MLQNQRMTVQDIRRVLTAGDFAKNQHREHSMQPAVHQCYAPMATWMHAVMDIELDDSCSRASHGREWLSWAHAQTSRQSASTHAVQRSDDWDPVDQTHLSEGTRPVDLRGSASSIASTRSRYNTSPALAMPLGHGLARRPGT